MSSVIQPESLVNPTDPTGACFINCAFSCFCLKMKAGGMYNPAPLNTQRTVVVSPFSALAIISTCLDPFAQGSFVSVSARSTFEDTHVCSTNAGHWLEWECSRNCSDSRLHRKWFCPSLAECHQENQTKESNCFVGRKCPSDCLNFHWGPDCNYTCLSCTFPCDKFTGRCVQCNKGFKNPDQACNDVCGSFEYGTDCAEDCRKKCKGEECFERRDGTCIIHGGWSVWTQWTCNRACEQSGKVRFRYCNNPDAENGGRFCFGQGFVYNDIPCNVGIKCPEDCPYFLWGYGCNETCNTNCINDCNKEDGSCLCKAGFQGATCRNECGIFHYGVNCSGDCRIKCFGQDCINRATGDCKIHYLRYIPLVLSILLLPICIYYCVGPKDIDLDFVSGEEDDFLPNPKQSYHESNYTSVTHGATTMSSVDDETVVEIYKPGTRESTP